MVVLGVDPHKKTHTVVAADPAGQKIAVITVNASAAGHLRLMRWAARFALDGGRSRTADTSQAGWSATWSLRARTSPVCRPS